MELLGGVCVTSIQHLANALADDDRENEAYLECPEIEVSQKEKGGVEDVT